MQINFYQTNDLIYKSITPILTKILEENKKALILCKDENLLTEIDDGLWHFSKTKFVPHGSEKDKISKERQPILLTNQEENSNNSNYLIMLDKAEDKFIKEFDKTFYFFNSDSLKKSQDLWRHYKSKSADLNFYKKEQDKWVKAA